MDDSGYVPLKTISRFHKVLSLSSNIDDIMEALKSSENVVVDEVSKQIKPAITFERKTVILRDVPAEVTEEEVRALFDGMGVVESATKEFEGTWFVVMESEAAAVAALELLRQRSLHDQPVKARLKNESYLKNLVKMLTTSEDGIPAEYLPVDQSYFMNFGGQPLLDFQQSQMFGQNFAVQAPATGVPAVK